MDLGETHLTIRLRRCVKAASALLGRRKSTTSSLSRCWNTHYHTIRLRKIHPKKNPHLRTFSEYRLNAALFNFVFFVQDVLARHRVELHELELVWRCFLVLVRGVEMSGLGG